MARVDCTRNYTVPKDKSAGTACRALQEWRDIHRGDLNAFATRPSKVTRVSWQARLHGFSLFWLWLISHGAAENWNDCNCATRSRQRLISLHRALLRNPGGMQVNVVQVSLNNNCDLAPIRFACPDHFGVRTGIGTAHNSIWPA